MSETMTTLLLAVAILFSIWHSSLQYIERVLTAILYKILSLCMHCMSTLWSVGIYWRALLTQFLTKIWSLKIKFRVRLFLLWDVMSMYVPLCQCWWGRTSLWFPLFLHPGLIPFCTLNTSLIFLFFFLHGVINYFLFFLHLFFDLLIFVLFPTWKNSVKSELMGVWVQIF